jgi:hypothetical protein
MMACPTQFENPNCPASGGAVVRRVAFALFRGMVVIVNARDFLDSLRVKCPAYEMPVPDCPLKSFRESLSSAANPFSELSDDQVDELVREHFLCVCRKEGCGS